LPRWAAGPLPETFDEDMPMTPQERDIISGIFDRLRQVEAQPRDPEAVSLVAARVQEQPYAPYAMAQAVYVQEQALLQQQAEIERLQGELESLRSQPASGGGFLSSLFGGGSAPQPEPRRNALPGQRAGIGGSALGVGLGARAGMPATGMAPGGMTPGGMAQQGMPASGPWAQRQGGGFLQTAAATAAGVAGGMVVGSLLMNAFGGGAAEAAQPDAAADAGAAGETAAADAPAYEPAAHETAYDDGGFDAGGDEWA
jgi:hypothetical protein